MEQNMPPPSPRRGLQIMRTQSTRKATNNLSSPELYIRLTSLEMERARRAMERDRLLERVRILEGRIVKIVEEQAEMRARIDQNAPASLSDSKDTNGQRDNGRDSQFGFTY